ncbi:MAG: CCA tRNA nucleotidyltransferase [Pseudoflavonifractor sp.]|nr:CCA tRNA nucleotidyltransferase [Alloprevotella sp.]MCM1117544.1 CCA tRNA nucleotidyltransferase [Pseudoflavonifractor sp.]
MTVNIPAIHQGKIKRVLELHPELAEVGAAADELGLECYVVGGFVRDIFLGRPSKDIDFVAVGSGIELAKAVARRLGRKARLAIFKSYGTAQVTLRSRDLELEFVGARRESYSRDSRNPIVEDGTLDDDIARRDFTINAMAICVNSARMGELVDHYDGLADLDRGEIRTPLDPDITFSDDPLRMMRAIRFATRFDFTIIPSTLEAITRNASRIEIIARERIATELMKIMESDRPSKGWRLLEKTGLLRFILPELDTMKGIKTVNGRGHKDNFLHTMEVLDNVASRTTDVWTRWAALLHDIAKPVTQRWDDILGWTFHNHNFIGAKMIPKIFHNLRLPLGEPMKFVAKLVELHMRPIALVEDEVTDSAVRRLLHDAGDDIDSLMLLCRADITSKNPEKVRRLLANFDHVVEKMEELEARDHIRNYQPPVDGLEIMTTFSLEPCALVGTIKSAIKDAILDGRVANDHDAARQYMFTIAKELGLTAPASTLRPDQCQ